jgi:hypothetical protein
VAEVVAAAEEAEAVDLQGTSFVIVVNKLDILRVCVQMIALFGIRDNNILVANR